MPPSLIAIAPVLIAVFILIAGHGMTNTLAPLRGAAEGFSQQALGLMGSIYFVGMLAGSFTAPAMVARVGHIRAFSAYAAIAAIVTLSFPIFIDPVAWTAGRFVIGVCLAGLYACAESWINNKAENNNRGRLLGAYNITHFCGSALGQQLLRLGDVRSFTLFSFGAALFMLSLAPLALTRAEPPAPPKKGRIDPRGLWRASPVAVVGIALIGWVNGAFWMMTPVYAARLGLGTIDVADLMTVVILGSALSPYPVGWLSDRMDRRRVLAGLAVAAALVEIVLFALGAPSRTALLVGGFLLGFCLPVMYATLTAHAADRMGRDRMLEVSSTLLFTYCLGAISGPIVVSEAMARFGTAAFQAHNAIVHLLLAAYVVSRIFIRATPTIGAPMVATDVEVAKRTVG